MKPRINGKSYETKIGNLWRAFIIEIFTTHIDSYTVIELIIELGIEARGGNF